MNPSDFPVEFIERFHRVWSRARRARIGVALCCSGLLLALGVVLLAAADYRLEAPWELRAAGLGLLAASVGALGLGWIYRVFCRWSQPAAAAAIEHRFPQLGQQVRTAVQFGGRPVEALEAVGVRPSMALALQEETVFQTEPLAIENVVPKGSLRAFVGVTALAALALLAGAVADGEWGLATRRAMLAEEPYTTIAAKSEDLWIDKGQEASLAVTVTGRTARAVTLQTRPTDQPETAWTERAVTEDEMIASAPGLAEYRVALLPELPLDYRFVAGAAATEIHRVNIHYPLNIKRLQIELSPPAYTRISPITVEDGNLEVVEGTRAKFHIELDRVCETASLLLAPSLVGGARSSAPQETLPLQIDGTSLSLELELLRDATYSIDAQAADGMRLPANRYVLRVRKDQPPQVWFEAPDDAYEVHPLAEIVMRARARDDFGLSQAGIVFQINNEEERTLTGEDFAELADHLAENPSAPRAQATLERLLPLEGFQLTQKDSITYYAFAEDNFPGGGRRTQTDLRFIDIRPFKRTYRLADAMQPEGNGRSLASLEELISRQRNALNRTTQLAQWPTYKGPIELTTVDRLAEFQGTLAVATRELAEFLEAIGFDGSDLLYQAEEAMLSAVDSLSAGKYDNAYLQERDAVRYLIEGRNKVAIFIMNSDAAALASLRAFDRMQRQKLRRPKSESAESIVDQLRQLAAEEGMIADQLSSLGAGDGDSEGGKDGKEKEDPAKKKPSGAAKAKSDDENPSKADKPASEQASAMAREELQKRQTEIVDEALALEKVMENEPLLSALARSRMSEATKSADDAAAALQRGNSKQSLKQAASAARTSAGMFGELARQAEGLLEPDAAQRIAMARDLSAELAARQWSLGARAERLSKQEGSKPEPDSQRAGAGKDASKAKEEAAGGGMDDKQPGPNSKGAGAGKEMPTAKEDPATKKSGGAGAKDQDDNAKPEDELAGESSRLAESAKTLDDILKALGNSNAAVDQQASRLVRELLAEGELKRTVERMEQTPSMAGAEKWQEIRRQTRDIADGLERTAARLDAAYLSIVEPRVAELARLERKAAGLEEKLKETESPSRLLEWKMEAKELIEELDRSGAATAATEELKKTLGLGVLVDDEVNRKARIIGGVERYGPEQGYLIALRKVTESLRIQIQELALEEHIAAGAEPVPPKYESLVERYYQVLSSGKGKND